MSSVLIVGAGAIGQWLAALLRDRAGLDVSLLVRPRQLQSLVEGVFIDGRQVPVHAFAEIPEGFRCDDLIFTVKAFQVEAAAEQCQYVETQRVWGFQNGYGSDAILQRYFPNRWFGAMTTTVPVAVEGNRVLPTNRGGNAWAAARQPEQAPDWVNRLGLPCVAVPRIDSLKCSKLLLNITCNASCALLDVMPGQVVGHRAMFDFELACLREFLSVMKALQIPVADLPSYKVTQMAALRPLPNFLLRPILGGKIEKARGQKPPSLLIDLRAGRPQSEVDVLNGAVVEMGKQAGLPTPGNAWLHQQLAEVVADPARWSATRGQIDAVARQAHAALVRK